jgi:hypothetical protein
MAYRITATTADHKELLDQIRELAWRTRQPISEVIAEALASYLDINAIEDGKMSLSPRRFEPRKRD